MLSEKLNHIFEKYNGNLPVKVAIEEGINRETLRKAFLRGDLSKPYPAGYTLPDAFVDDYFFIQSILTRGIVSHESAAMFYEYGNFNPFYCYMTFPRGYHNPNVAKYKVRETFVNKDHYNLGMSEVKTWFGNKIVCYDKERTVLDILSSPHSSAEVMEKVWKDYLNDEERNLERLFEYQEKMNRMKPFEVIQINQEELREKFGE